MKPPSHAAYFSGANQASVTAFDDVLHDIGDLAAMLPTMEDKQIIWTTRHHLRRVIHHARAAAKLSGSTVSNAFRIAFAESEEVNKAPFKGPFFTRPNT